MNKLVSSKDYELSQSIEKRLLTFELPGNSILSSDVQEEMSKSIVLLKRVDRYLIVANSENNQTIKQQLEVIASTLNWSISLLQQSPQTLVLAKKIRRDAEFTVREFTNPIIGRLINGFKYVLYESNTSVKVLFGLGIAIPIYLMVPDLPYEKIIVQPLITPIISENQHPSLSQNVSTSPSKGLETPPITQYDVDRTIALLVLVGIAGSLGSIVSILTRIKEYENEKYTDSILPILIGAFKPLIGGVFGIFLFTLLSSGFLPLQIKNDNSRPIDEWYTLFALAFIAGFSERLVKDIISQTEKKVIATSTTTSTFNQVEEQKVSSQAATNSSTFNQVEEQKDSSQAAMSSGGNVQITD